MKEHDKPGTIYQFKPDHATLPCQFIVATEIKEFGIQGYVLLDQPESSLVRFRGRAYMRPKWNMIVRVGSVEWLHDNKGEQDEQT